MPENSISTSKKESILEYFGCNVFSSDVMRERLPKRVFQELTRTREEGKALDPYVADVVANAMKDWAVERGATHYCHWFQPLTGLTAEKHTSFLSPAGDRGFLMEFSGKDLIQGEPDASSFPSGSLRESFEARGYTVWDYTSPAFVKEDGDNITLFIPSAFCSYTGKALDYKTPLLRANEAINRNALRILRILGDTKTRRVDVTLGVEQEYFLIDRKFIPLRLDLMETGRTIFGARPPKNMALSVHYFGAITEEVASFMNEVNLELWKLGISADTQHHEISPCQFEIASVFATVNVSTDQNQLVMQTLQKVARRHGLECLLHDKPFSTLGGSGKHINWSLASDWGANLLDPGETPHENEIFLIFLGAVIKAVDRYPTLIRESVADAGNDHRLGAMEAPPAIISIFLGDELLEILKRIGNRESNDHLKSDVIKLGVSSLPPLPKDLTDRNRTSPFAFTGNRFEFRTPGSAVTTARPAFAITAAVADALGEIAQELEMADDINTVAQDILKGIIKEHGRIIFNGDNYSEEWVAEAERRGLPNLPDTIDALAAVMNEEIIRLFERNRILTHDEFQARLDSSYEHYALQILIEGRCALKMAQCQILPRVMEYSARLASGLRSVEEAGFPGEVYRKNLKGVSSLMGDLQTRIEELEEALGKTEAIPDIRERAVFARDRMIPVMSELRHVVDSLEMVVDSDLWPLPTYAHMVYGR